MPVDGTTLASPRLRRLTQRAPAPSAQAVATPVSEEQCELCGAPLADDHRHLVDLEKRELLCACRACGLLFDRAAAGGGHFRLVGDRRLALEDFVLDDDTWEQLRIPVQMAFFFEHSRSGRVAAFYPSPMGATESLLGLEAWRRIAEANPVMATMQPDVEALLVNRRRPPHAQRHWLVPIDDCYRLVALIRTGWRGFTGGREVWEGIEHFFADLDRRARSGGRDGNTENTRRS